MVMATAALCLAMNLYQEARGEHMLGQLMVAQVTMNRAGHDPANVCKVVTAKLQFSWTQRCLVPSKAGWQVRPECAPHEAFAWAMAQRAAQAALTGRLWPLTCADHFYGSQATQPQWTKGMKRSLTFGGHHFYVSKAAQNTCTHKSSMTII